MTLKLKRTPGIYLVGFMGSGKTTVGERLADELGWTFVDLDADIVREQGCSIAEMFDVQGEEAFRAVEAEAIRRRVRAVQSGRPVVMALGGGAFVQEGNYQLLHENGVSIWLDCPLERIRERLHSATDRPLARDAERFAALYEQRRPGYAKADYRVEITSDDAAEAVRAILALPLF
jgi:shikimate kinase